jgi:hypothetical protein
MAQAFTITTNLTSFSASVQRTDLDVGLTKTDLSVTKVTPGFTATVLVNGDLIVNSTDSGVAVTSQVASVFTSTRTDILIDVVEQTIAQVDVVSYDNTISVVKPQQPITINYDPTIVSYVFEGQPVYTTSSVQFAELTLGTTSTFKFPTTDGVNGQVLTTNGLGQLYWAFGGGGGGLGQWSLNTDLLTNGFRIVSGADNVDLKIIGGGKLLDLAPDRVFLGAGTNRLEINNGVVLRDGNNRIEATPSVIRLQNANAGIEIETPSNTGSDRADISAEGSRLRLTNESAVLRNKDTFGLAPEEVITWPRIALESKSVNIRGQFINIGQNSQVSIGGPLIALSGVQTSGISSAGGVVDVPILRFPDGSQLSTAFIGTNTAYTTGTLVLNGDLYSNGYNLRLTSNSWIGFDNDVFLRRLRFDTTEVNLETNRTSVVLVDNPGSTSSSIILNADLVQVSAPMSVGQIRFADGTVQTSALPIATGTVQTIVANTGISISTATGVVEITNTGVRRAEGRNGIIVSKQPWSSFLQGNEYAYPSQGDFLGSTAQQNEFANTGDVVISIGNLPIVGGYGIDIDQEFLGETTINVNSATLAENIIAGEGIIVTRNGGRVTVATTSQFSAGLTGDLRTRGFKIDGETNRLDIEAGKFVFLGTTQTSRISMPRNAPMQIYSDFGINIDTPDQNPIQILSPFRVLHRNGDSRISTDALGQMTLNDVRIAITGTNRVVINQSTFFNDNITLRSATGSSSLYLGPTEAIITATNFRVATTATFKIGSDLNNSKLAVQEITNFNETGPVTFRRGIQFQDLTVQRTAYIGGLDFGAIAAPATNLETFLLQLQTVDFGTIENPGTLAYDAGVIE